MEAATSSPSAPITGATAAIAELPQIELPQATSKAMRGGRRSRRPMTKLAPMADATTPAMPSSIHGPAARIVFALIDTPSRTTATSSRIFALKPMPGNQRRSGVHRLRTLVPITIASTKASSQARPKSASSALWAAKAAPVTARHKARPGSKGRKDGMKRMGGLLGTGSRWARAINQSNC
jgi:hypothetical protein